MYLSELESDHENRSVGLCFFLFVATGTRESKGFPPQYYQVFRRRLPVGFGFGNRLWLYYIMVACRNIIPRCRLMYACCVSETVVPVEGTPSRAVPLSSQPLPWMSDKFLVTMEVLETKRNRHERAFVCV